MTGQAINENSIDDFTQEELQIIADAFFHYEKVLQDQPQATVKPFQRIFNGYVKDVQEVQKKVFGFINT